MANENLDPGLARTAYSEPSGDVKIFSTSGRLGRVRYIAYNIGFGLLAYLVAGAGLVLVSMILPRETAEFVSAALFIIVALVIFVWTVIWTVRRCHDFNTTGWLSLIIILPLIPIIFWFIPGTRGENKYGPETPPNGGGAIAIACLLPVVFFAGILAAIAIPAYQDYTQRAQIGEAFTIVSGAKMAIAEFVQTKGYYPDDTTIGSLGLELGPSAGQYVDSVAIEPDTGTITVAMKGPDAVGMAIAYKTVTFRPPSDLGNMNGVFTWDCTSTTEQKYLPRSCASEL